MNVETQTGAMLFPESGRTGRGRSERGPLLALNPQTLTREPRQPSSFEEHLRQTTTANREACQRAFMRSDPGARSDVGTPTKGKSDRGEGTAHTTGGSDRHQALRTRDEESIWCTNGCEAPPPWLDVEAPAGTVLGIHPLQTQDDAVLEQTYGAAAILLQTTVIEITQVLSLNVGADIEHLDLKNPSEFEKEQLAQMLASLRGISSLLGEAVREGESLEMSGRVLEPVELAGIHHVVQVSVFRVEYALSMLGLSAEMALRSEMPISALAHQGVAVAFDPGASVHPVSEQLRELASGGAQDGEQDLDSMVRMLALALRVRIAATSREGSSSTPGMLSGIDGLDAPTRRELLLEMDVTVEENRAAASSGGKMDLSTMQTVTVERGFLALGEKGEGVPVQLQSDVDAAGAGAASRVPAFSLESGSSRLLERIEQVVLQQVNGRFQQVLRAGAGVHEVRMMLRPETLGEVHLRVQMEGDIVMARLHVENQQVKEIIENNLQALRNALAEHNLTSGSFSVDVGNGGMHEPGGEGRSARAGKRGSRSGPQETAVSGGGLVPTGIETGRRYGHNSVEYFA